MKLTCLLPTIVTLLIHIHPTAFAQISSPWIGVHGSFMTTKLVDDGFGAGVQGGVSLNKYLFIEIRASKYETLKKTVVQGPITFTPEVDLTPLELGLGWRKTVKDSLAIYGSAGVYFMQVDADYFINGQLTDFKLEDDTGYYATLGASTDRGSLRYYAELQYRRTDAKITSPNFPVELSSLQDLSFSQSSLNVGVSYRW